MQKFFLESSALESAIINLDSIYECFENICSTIDSYDVNNENNFNFSGAIKKISKNVSAMSTTINNTKGLINTVLDAHMTIQSALVYSSDTSFESVLKTLNNSASSAGVAQGTVYSSSNKTSYSSYSTYTGQDIIDVTDVVDVMDDAKSNYVVVEQISIGCYKGVCRLARYLR